ncbi:MAG: GEVED domain-containing protein, partial [Bacteroidota bacterium]
LADNFQFVTRGCGACYDATFCTAAAQDAQQEWIASVKLGNWEHTSGQGGAGYQDFSGKTDSIPVIMPLSSVSVAITPGFWGGGYKEYYRVFIDYNFNGVFEIPAELAFDSGFSLQGTLTGNIQTPFFTTAGITRMRVLMKYTEVDPAP